MGEVNELIAEAREMATIWNSQAGSPLSDLLGKLADALEGLVSAPTDERLADLIDSVLADWGFNHPHNAKPLADMIADAILAAGFRLPVVPVSGEHAKLIEELEFVAENFVMGGRRNGEPLPLADFTRERIAKAMTDAAGVLGVLPVPVYELSQNERYRRIPGVPASEWELVPVEGEKP